MLSLCLLFCKCSWAPLKSYVELSLTAPFMDLGFTQQGSKELTQHAPEENTQIVTCKSCIFKKAEDSAEVSPAILPYINKSLKLCKLKSNGNHRFSTAANLLTQIYAS